jgi:hypothetical protein
VGHPLARRKLTVARYAEVQRAFIAPSGRPGGAVDDALAKLARSRHIAFTTRRRRSPCPAFASPWCGTSVPTPIPRIASCASSSSKQPRI